MKNLLLTLALFFPVFTFSQNFNGVWVDSSSADFSNCTAVFSIKKDSVFMTHYLEFQGHPFVEYGSGIVKGNQIQYTVYVTVQVPGWNTSKGYHVLTISEDGKTLRGTYEDNAGNKGKLVFKRKYPIQGLK
ncbi:MAG: hypothetical protein CMD35_05760 [Flavobacteriales bacterium]|nr:hypothetical protein [Flavobacteriales bacterium]|tara:strand:- start:44 stop:436 length:393 start_codon:yes stop_codon:yes gene_type:complete